jgi:hypothetical protein
LPGKPSYFRRLETLEANSRRKHVFYGRGQRAGLAAEVIGIGEAFAYCDNVVE